MENTERLRLYLEKELEARSRKNPRYSLRAFAKSLSVDSSYLSKVLSQKRNLNNKALYSFAEKLNFPKELDFIQDAKQPNHSKPELNELSIDQFKVISDWYHYAILEIIHLDEFMPDTHWIAKNLNISYGEAYAAINRLTRLNLLVIDKNGKWKSVANTTTKNQLSTLALRNLQRQILQKAIEAMENTDFEERDQSSITLCVDKDRLAEAKERIKVFRRELMQFLESGKNKDEVYQMSFSLFPITKTKKRGMNNEK